MDDSALAVGIATAGVLVFLAPAVALFFGGVPSRRGALWLLAVATAALIIATAEWMLLGQPAAVALYQGALASIPVLMIATVGYAVLPRWRLLVFLSVWLIAVVVPAGQSLFDIENGFLAATIGTLDFAGACALGIVPATAAVALAIVTGRGAGERALHRPTIVLVACAVAGFLGFVAVAVGAELVIDDTTIVLVRNALVAAGGGIIGWTAAQIANVHRASYAGVVAGTLAGSIVVLPASPWLEPVAVGVLSVIAGLLGHLVTMAIRSTRARDWSTVVGVLLVPAALGVVGAGIVAAGPGLLYSGHSDLAEAQLLGLAAVVLVALGAALLIALAAFRLFPRSSGTRRETAARAR